LPARRVGRVDRAAAAVTVALAVIVGVGATGPVRMALAVAFVTFVPGWALFGRSTVAQGISKVALVVAASFTACLAAAVTMAWVGSWHPLALFYGLGGITIVAVLRPTSSNATSPVLPAQKVRPLLRSEDLRLTVVTIRAAFSTRPPFLPHELPEFFARIHERHPFVSFNLEGDTGAVMETAGSLRLVVRRDYAEYREMNPDFDQVREHAVDAFEEVQTRLGVAALTTSSCRLQARWDLQGDGSDRSPLLEQVAGLHRSDAILGSTGPVSVALQFTGNAAELGHTWHLSVEPRPGDAVLLDLTTDASADANDAAPLGEQLGRAHLFLVDKAAPFVASMAGTTPDG
jgi:hypothetical protein